MKKRILATIMSVAMVATLLVGCGAKEAEAPAAEAPAAEAPAAEEPAAEEPAAEAPAAGEAYHFEVIVKSFQSSYWQAAVTGINQACEELGVTANCTGPNAESDIADQVNMLNNAINSAPNGIGLAACDAEAVLDSLQTALDKGIPVVCFDAGVPNAPAGSVIATCATDNYAAGSVAAENMYPALKDKIASAGAPVRIGEVNQDATGANIIERGLGFIETFAKLAIADGYKVAIIGNEKYVNDASANVETVAEGEADIIIEVAVPAQTTVELCATEASAIMNKSDLIGIFGSNQVSADHTEVIMTKDEVLANLETVIQALETYDITTIRASMGMYLVCKAIHENTDIKVLLTGEISDELFGYKYTDFAPGAKEFQEEAAKRIRELYCYDVLRADRCLAANSLEARVPFGDLDFVRYVMAIDPAKKLNTYGKGKYLLRKAFEKDAILPEEILWREKAAFSDAVGHSMVDDLKEYANNYYTDEEFETLRKKYDFATPFTKESLLYREIFEKYYPGQAAMIPDFWMPNKEWEGCNVDDPSARVLANYGDSGK